MTFSSSLSNDCRPLVLDTSVLINLNACAYGEQVLTAISNPIAIPDLVSKELEHETSHNNGERNFLHTLIAKGKVSVIGMNDTEYDLFQVLVSGFSSLDDGEAATISIATYRGFRAVIDERKGRAWAAAQMNGEEPGWSLDLLRHPSFIQNVGERSAMDATYMALREGRMRIPVDRISEIIDLIGPQRALECTCLPNFKSLLRQS